MRERNGLSSEGFVQALMNAFENGFIGRFVEIGGHVLNVLLAA